MASEIATILAKPSISASRFRRWMLTAALGLAVTGCVNPAFRESVGQFGTLTKATAGAQQQGLAAVVAGEQERLRAGLARDRVQLALGRDCASALAVPDQDPPTEDNVPAAAETNLPAGAEQTAELPRCQLVAVQQGGEPIPQAATYENIVALSSALANYSDSLVALAAGASADQKAFADSLSQLATSVGGLNGAIRKAAGAPEQDLSQKLGAIAGFVAEVGNLYFAYQRDHALRQIIVRAGPFVERAVALLIEADQALQLFNDNRRLTDLRTAQREAQEAAANPRNSESQIRAAQNRLYASLDAYNRGTALVQPFRAVGVAHVRLVRAARSGASAAELRAAIEAILHLASTTRDTIATLRGANGSNDNAN